MSNQKVKHIRTICYNKSVTYLVPQKTSLFLCLPLADSKPDPVCQVARSKARQPLPACHRRNAKCILHRNRLYFLTPHPRNFTMFLCNCAWVDAVMCDYASLSVYFYCCRKFCATIGVPAKIVCFVGSF